MPWHYFQPKSLLKTNSGGGGGDGSSLLGAFSFATLKKIKKYLALNWKVLLLTFAAYVVLDLLVPGVPMVDLSTGQVITVYPDWHVEFLPKIIVLVPALAIYRMLPNP
jgi:hypothetical protein